MNTTIINLNGPPKSGKDTICKELSSWIDLTQHHVIHMEFKELLFDVAVKAAGITRKLWDALYEREYKERPCPYLYINGNQTSPRGWLIHCSESVMKPIFGDDVFGKSFVERLKKEIDSLPSTDKDVIVVVSDGGFIEESIPVVEFVGPDNYYLFRLHRMKNSGEEYDFSGDSRKYLYAEDFPEHLRPRDFDILNVEGDLTRVVREILARVSQK